MGTVTLSWVTVNLPWREVGSDARKEVNDLSSDYEKWFEEIVKPRFGSRRVPDEYMDRMLMGETTEIDGIDFGDEHAYRDFMAREVDPVLRATAECRRARVLENRFEDVDPACQVWVRRIKDAVERSEAAMRTRQFCSHPMCRPGVVIEVVGQSGAARLVVIGDVDPSGWDHALPRIDDEEIVTRYMDLRSAYGGGDRPVVE